MGSPCLSWTWSTVSTLRWLATEPRFENMQADVSIWAIGGGSMPCPTWVGPSHGWTGTGDRTIVVVSEPLTVAALDAIIDDEGNAVISVRQLPVRFPAGTHVRVWLEPVAAARGSIEGALPDLPDLSWEDFEAASHLAAREAEPGRQVS